IFRGKIMNHNQKVSPSSKTNKEEVASKEIKKENGGKQEEIRECSSQKFFCCFKTYREQLIVYLLLFIGLLLTFFGNILVGGLLIGMVAGYYFSGPIIYFVRNLNQIFKGQDQIHYLILAVLAIGLFLDAPGIFIGALVVAAFKHVISGNP